MPARILLASLVLLASLAGAPAAQGSPIGYAIDLTDRADDRFKVTAWVSGLTPDNAVYQFAATAPGTYQIMDIGRFVRSFEAFDAAGRPVPAERVSVNQWKLGDAPRVRTIRYSIAETWDTKVDRHEVYLMCGTSMEKDHVLINPHAVIGYPTGMQARPVRLRLKYPASWKAGTALGRDRGGAYVAEDYDHLVDSPILLGRLSEARTTVTGVPVEIFTYSKTDKIKSAQLLGAMNGMLQAAGRFLGKLPVDRYTFLYHFEDRSAGAWEHSLSYPGIGDFFDRYVWESERLPIAEYYGKMGIRLVEGPDGMPVGFEMDSSATPEQRRLRAAWLGRQPRPAS